MVNDSIELTQSTFGNIAGYVMQDDILYEYFTPREALRFAARLKLKVPVKEQELRVDNLLKEL